MKKRMVLVAAIELPVVGARRVLADLVSCKSGRSLSGGQRQFLDDVISSVEYAITAETDGVVQISTELVDNVLRCLGESQTWMEFD